jgi:methylisocitrate lyase
MLSFPRFLASIVRIPTMHSTPSPAARRHALNDRLAAGRTVVVPGCHDALSAMLAVEAAEGGFHEPGNIWRTVRAFEDAGVAAIHIEDHAGGKHTDLPQTLIPLDAMLARLRAAQDARRDPAFRIVARTDAVWATGDPAEALRRVRAFADAGIDMVFPTGATPDMVAAFKAAVPAHYVVIDGPNHPRFAGRETAASLVLYYGFSLFAAARAMTTALGRFRADPAADLDDLLEPVDRFEARLGYAAFTDRARRYGPR